MSIPPVEERALNKDLRIVGLIPARLGSVRVKCKNLRLLAGKPLIYYTIRNLQQATCFDQIYVNSESPLIGEVAQRYGIPFYQRPAELAADDSLIDAYLYEFLCHVECDVLVVVNPTSPFLTSQEIDACVAAFVAGDADTQLACEDVRTHCFLHGQAVNFDTDGQHPRSQDLEPIKALNFAVTVWDAHKFRAQFEAKGHAVYTGKLGFYSFHGLSTIDIDWEDDFRLAEMLMKYRHEDPAEARYDPVLDGTRDGEKDRGAP